MEVGVGRQLLGWAVPANGSVPHTPFPNGHIHKYRAGTVPTVPGWAALRAGVAAHARARLTGRARPGMVLRGPCHAWARPKHRAFMRAADPQAKCPTIVEMEAMRDRADLLMKTDSKETRIHKPLPPFFTKETWINKPPSPLFTAAALPLHGSEECY
jgi:hypothetical protein